MKICFFVGSMAGKGGTERGASLIGNGLQERGYEVVFLSLWEGLKPTYSLSDGIAVYELYPRRSKFKWKYFDVVGKLRKFILKEKIDVLVSTDVYGVLYASPACWRTDILHCAWENFNFLANLGLFSRKLSRIVAAKTADKIVVLTKRDVELWKKNVRGRATYHVIPYPLIFIPLSEERGWQNKVAIAVGRYSHQKGFDLLIASWKMVFKNAPDWKLLIVGTGELEKDLKDMVNREGLSQVIEFVPFSQSIDEYYRMASIYCLSSRFEGLPMVLIEAQAFGLPSVAFDCNTGPADIIENGVNGILVPDGDLAAFSDGVVTLAGDVGLRRSMGLNALAMANRFEMEVILDTWEKDILQQPNTQ